MNEYTAKNNDFTKFNENKWMSLVKVDKNGSHHYIDSRCPKCGGEGHIFGYEHVDGGRCFMCGGSGRYERKVIVRTEEYARKLAEKREKQNREKAEAHNREFLKKGGYFQYRPTTNKECRLNLREAVYWGFHCRQLMEKKNKKKEA